MAKTSGRRTEFIPVRQRVNTSGTAMFPTSNAKSKLNCAIYVRKSTEYGLEQEFNSLNNQEEACRAYIASQSFNSWGYYKTYTDGGISGGTTARPALQEMLEDIKKKRIQVVLVYKVDRLSRSIMDFHNMMKVFDKYNCNFVSITQSFDTSNSMGKLTLNMLLSFAQFEREVSSERVRDKIRASRAKGIWTGGVPWLGYDVVDKKLVVNPAESEQVRTIFEKYLELGSVVGLSKHLRRNGIFNKKWTTARGKIMGGNPISTMTLHRILREKIYIGQIEHKRNGTVADATHDAILSVELFDAVAEKLKHNTNGKMGRDKNSANLLTGKLYNSNGIKFTNQRTSGIGKRDRLYYATRGFYIPAVLLDKVATDTVAEFLDSDMTQLPDATATTLKQINFGALAYPIRRAFIQTIIEKVIYSNNQMMFFIKPDRTTLKRFITNTINQNNIPMDYAINDDIVIIKKDIIFRKNLSPSRYNDGKTGMITISENNHLIVKAFATAWKFREIYEESGMIDFVTKKEKTSERNVFRYLNLAYMHPNKINAIMSGTEQCTIDELFTIAAQNQF